MAGIVPALAEALLEHLRVELREPRLGYAEPPAPISGGYDTRIFAFRLSGAPEPFALPLILRVFNPRHSAARARREQVIQNVVAGLGYPAPRVLLSSGDPTIVDGAFLIMERLPGRPLLAARRLGVVSVLVGMQRRLHALDAEGLLAALDREGPPISREMVTFEGYLASLERRITHGNLSGLTPAMAWLVAHRSADGRRRVICHGDFHPLNILANGGEVTGVIDWANVVVADPAFDVAATRIILRDIPVALVGVPVALRGVVGVVLRVLAARYVDGYQRREPLPAGVVAYYEAAACMRALVRTAEARLAPIDDAGLNPLDASVFGERLSVRFARITGVAPTLPRVPQGARVSAPA